MPDLISQQVEERQPPHEIVIDLPDRDVALVTDALTCITKFLHVVQSCRANARRGALTWSVVDAYHAALLGGRAIAATMGVVPYLLGGRSYLVDFRPEFGTPQDRIKFRKTFGRQDSPILILSPRVPHFEQNDQWHLVSRLLRFALHDIEDASRLELLIEAAVNFPGEIRNAVVYDSLKWIWRADSSSLSQETLDPSKIAETLSENPAGTQFLDRIFSQVQEQFRVLASKVGLSSNSVPRSIDLAPSPHLLAA